MNKNMKDMVFAKQNIQRKLMEAVRGGKILTRVEKIMVIALKRKRLEDTQLELFPED